mgnify:CR=1 FL=1
MIKVKHLNKAFGSISVLRDLNLTVNGPLVLMGPSGCGKTTLLRILMGLETPDSGTVQGVGNIGAVFQESRLCPQLTAVGNICLVGGVNPAQAQAELQTLGFTQAELALPVARLSGGQQRRTALLRALLCQPVQTLLLDEPFTGMDPELVSHAAAAVVRLGRLALPGCVQETTCWARETQEQTFTPETAAALARRSARLQLLQDYPDAVIESERDFASTTATAAVCRAVFVFCANIAEPRSAPAASG